MAEGFPPSHAFLTSSNLQKRSVVTRIVYRACDTRGP
jgi:hypothetical protein